MHPLDQLAPALLWQHFKMFCDTPRPSKAEAAIVTRIYDWAIAHQLDVLRDDIGNLLIRKPATTGYEHAPTIALQAHVDMVCQKQPDSPHDFYKDPLHIAITDGWVHAQGTTLGADNAIGAAAALAVLESQDLAHGPLEVLLTVDEEAGMGGVRHLSKEWLKAQYLLNLDAESWGSCFIGCAGGVDLLLSQPYDFIDTMPEQQAIIIEINGLKGGHSGLDIDKNHASANVLLIELLHDLAQHFPIGLAQYLGGTLRNAITRDAQAQFLCPSANYPAVLAHIEQLTTRLQTRFQGLEHIQVRTRSTTLSHALSVAQSHQLLAGLRLLPHGVLINSPILDQVVDTSCNIGTLQLNAEQGLKIALMARSLNPAGIIHSTQRTQALAQLTGWQLDQQAPYPGWQPNVDGVALAHLCRVYQEQNQSELRVRVIHAGLECGLLGQHYPHLDMVSFGPSIRGAHSPDERVEIASVERFWQLLTGTLASFISEVS